MIDWQRVSVTVVAAILAAACAGGSGSTGLIVPEGALLDRVRREGTCISSGATEFCATGSSEATTPSGARADGGELLASQPGPCPIDVQGDCAGAPVAIFDVRGFAAGAACATAARPAGSDGTWSTGELVTLAESPGRTAFPLPAALGDGEVEVVLLCFGSPPAALAATLGALVDAGADVAFVP